MCLKEKVEGTYTNIYPATGLSRPIQYMSLPPLTRGFSPKSLPRESAQLNRAGRGVSPALAMQRGQQTSVVQIGVLAARNSASHAGSGQAHVRRWCQRTSPSDETSVYPGQVYRGACWTDDSPVHKTTAFIPARLADNPLYGREKLESLLSQSKAIQQQLLYGCWCNAAGLYFDFMRPDDVVPYASIGDSWWWQHFLSIDYGFGNSSAATGMYAISPGGTVFKTRERIERKMAALKFAKCICKDGFPKAEYPFQGPQDNWLKKLKPRDPEPPRMSFCVMDEAMDQHRGTGKSIYDVMSEVFVEHGIGCLKAAHDPAGNAQVLYNGLANKGIVLTRESADLPLTYRAISSRIVDERKAVKKIHGAWEDDSYDETSYAYNTWRQNSEKPARTGLQEELAQLRKDGMDESSLARIAWNREQTIYRPPLKGDPLSYTETV